MSGHVLVKRRRGRWGGTQRDKSIGSLFNCPRIPPHPRWRDFKKASTGRELRSSENIQRINMPGRGGAAARRALRDPAGASPGGVLLHFYYSDSRINLFSIFLSPAKLHIIYCSVGWGRARRGGGQLVACISHCGKDTVGV